MSSNFTVNPLERWNVASLSTLIEGESALNRPYLWAAALVLVSWSVFTFFFQTKRLPNVEFLRVANKPGKGGDADDVKALLEDSLGAIMKGYREYSKCGKHFLLRFPKQVYLIVSSKNIEELRKAPETHLSQPAAANIIFQTKHTFHPALEHDTYHFDVIKIKLAQALTNHIPDLVNESQFALDTELGTNAEWTAFNMAALASKILTRVVNRTLVGLDLCRNDDFLAFSATVTGDVFATAVKLRNYPEFMKAWIIYFTTDRNEQQATARRFLLPLIKTRLAAFEANEKGGKTKFEAENKRNDALQWLLEITPPEKRNSEILMQRMIHLNVNAIHPPTVTWNELMYDLCRHPELHDELRDEIANVLGNRAGEENVWTKSNVERLHKLDSFMRESVRLTPMSAIKDFSFSDGTLVPAGTSVGVISHGRHIDEDILENATQFDPFRYARAREQPGMDAKYTFAQASEDNLHFGLGRHACPGRHFASIILKVLLVRTLVSYDIKFVEGKPLPEGKWNQKFRNPDTKASIAWKPRPEDARFKGIFK